MTERRKEARLKDCDLVMLTWENDFGCLKQLGNVEDVSESGLGLVVGKVLPVMTRIAISYGDGELFGIVRHIEPRAFGFFLGIEFERDSQGSTIHFHPELIVSSLNPLLPELS